MAGHARERRPGLWELRAYVGRDPLSGKKKYATECVPASGRREAERMLPAFIARHRADDGMTPADVTFGELLDRWYAMRGPDMSPKGQLETRSIIDRRLRGLRDVKLSRLAGRGGTALLDEFYAALRARGGVCRLRSKCRSYPCKHGGGDPLEAATVVRTHVVVRAALEQAVRWEWIARNPATTASPGVVVDPEISPPAPADVLHLFALAEEKDPELVVFLILAAVTGARRGELCALTWADLDLEAGTATIEYVVSLGADGPVRVRKGRGRANKGRARRIALDPATVAVVRSHRTRCEERARLAGVALHQDGYVFASDGIGETPWRPDSTSRVFRRLRERADLPELRLHDLRHFVVTTLLSAGVDLRTVQGRVGHSAKSSTTLSVYAHFMEETDRAAAEILGRLLDRTAGEGAPDDPPAPSNVVQLRRPS